MRRLLQLSLLALVAAAPFSVRAAHASPAAVVAVQPTRVADLVLLDGGFDAGLRQGMVCRVTRGGTEIAEVLLHTALYAGLPAANSALAIMRDVFAETSSPDTD